jgi:hypothetical protein
MRCMSGGRSLKCERGREAKKQLSSKEPALARKGSVATPPVTKSMLLKKLPCRLERRKLHLRTRKEGREVRRRVFSA